MSFYVYIKGELGEMGTGQANSEEIRLCPQCSGKLLEGFKQDGR